MPQPRLMHHSLPSGGWCGRQPAQPASHNLRPLPVLSDGIKTARQWPSSAGHSRHTSSRAKSVRWMVRTDDVACCWLMWVSGTLNFHTDGSLMYSGGDGSHFQGLGEEEHDETHAAQHHHGS